MFLTVHSATGILVGQYVKNPLLAFLGGFILHYIFDIIPHGDTKVPKQYHNILYITLAGIIDLAAVISYLLIYMLFTNKFLSAGQILSLIGCLLPDGLQLIYFIYPGNKYLKQIHRVHHYFHDLITNKFEFSLWGGIIFQILIFILLLIISL